MICKTLCIGSNPIGASELILFDLSSDSSFEKIGGIFGHCGGNCVGCFGLALILAGLLDLGDFLGDIVFVATLRSQSKSSRILTGEIRSLLIQPLNFFRIATTSNGQNAPANSERLDGSGTDVGPGSKLNSTATS
jgi:hypothetical protein